MPNGGPSCEHTEEHGVRLIQVDLDGPDSVVQIMSAAWSGAVWPDLFALTRRGRVLHYAWGADGSTPKWLDITPGLGA